MTGEFTQIGWMIFGEYSGAACAAFIVHYTFNLGLPEKKDDDELTDSGSINALENGNRYN